MSAKDTSSDDIYNRPRGPWAKIQNVLVGILVAMLVLAFAVWGIEDVFRPNSTNAIVKVGDAEVSQPEFMDRFNQRMQDLARQAGEGLSNQQAFDQGIPQSLVGNFQSELAIEADAGDLGIGVNNRDVRAYTENVEAFRNDITGEFDEDLFEGLLRSNRITRAQYEEDVVRVLTQRQTLPAIMGGIRAPRNYAERYNTYVNEIRTARLLQLNQATLDSAAEPTDDEIRSYIAANQTRFTSPEYRQFLMLRLDPTDFQGNTPDDPRFTNSDEFPPDMFDVYVTEDEARARFDLLVSTGRIGSKETRDVTVLTAPDSETAERILPRLQTGEDASLVANEVGLGAPTQFTEIEADGLINPESSKIAFELAEGEAGLAETGFGTVEIVIVDTVRPAQTPDFNAERDDILRELIEGAAREKIADLETQIDDLLLNGKTVEEVAADLNLPLQAYPFIDRFGVTQDGVSLDGFARLPGIAQDRNLLNAIFAASEGFESEIIPTGNNGLAVFRVTDTISSAPRPFEAVRGEAAAALQAQTVERALTDKGVEIAERLNNGEAMEAIASQLGLEIQELAIQRANPPRQFSPQMLTGLFDGEPGDVARGTGAIPGTYDVAVLDSVSTGNERIGGQLLAQIQNNLSEQIAQDISSAYTSAILADHDAQIFEDQLRSALALDDAGL
jgi:peptidyl-prolyl cis-trans isomerase D